uniref:Uncharacterized protein n=1 Tax=Candidatus Kentrum sp. TUN TaxID=2126343 RepID=A0A450ZR11_9GAMM|nr:MAG: hypothetical protein BECKTUN1418D_GA0071000_103420 [Candidatus Kentron sp. TUN]VFK56216.1 MAG: hypothetical protein BECKTUN1418F_GA0071002_108212 [Candidatus Kentron sp. TUN]VFK62467.1 MAG: hypothetical protein BECKTUN1418E_GA0071001_108012 [Candidatus Kentron sp. TUN]
MKSDDWPRLLNPQATGTPTEDHPEADASHIARGAVRRNLKPLLSALSSEAADSPHVDRRVTD